MNKILFNKKTIVSLVTIIVIASSLIVYAKNNDLSYFLGQQVKSIQNKNDESIVATINNVEITRKGFESYKLTRNNTREDNNKFTDKEILDMIVERELLYAEAINNNITISDSMVDQTINIAKETLAKSPETYKQLTDYIEGLEISEEQYWEIAKPIYKKVLTCGQYKTSLKQSFAKEKDIKDQQQLTKQFDEYYKELVKELRDKSKIEFYGME